MMTDNSAAVAKLAHMLKIESAMGDDPVLSHIWVIDKILTAIQADPLAYVKPKPLGWVKLVSKECGVSAKTPFGIYMACGSYGCVRLTFNDNPIPWRSYSTIEVAQAAAYDDLCKRVKELF